MNNKLNLIWMDLEMTGLEPESDVIIEIATIVTDKDLNILAKGPEIAIHQPDSVLAQMDEWCTRTHGASGLTERVRHSTIDCTEAEAQTLTFIKEWVDQGKSPLCGNSIHQDRRFLYKYMPELSDWLHYRNIDVSSIKECARRWSDLFKPYGKTGAHTALADIEESIEELKLYRTTLFVEELR